MQPNLVIQGRELLPSDIEKIKELLSRHPEWSRRKVSLELCRDWQWVNDKGQVKDIACRSLLRKLENKGYVTLPPRRRNPVSRMKDQCRANFQLSFLSDLSTALTLAEAAPLTITIVSPKSADGKLFAALLAEHQQSKRSNEGCSWGTAATAGKVRPALMKLSECFLAVVPTAARSLHEAMRFVPIQWKTCRLSKKRKLK